MKRLPALAVAFSFWMLAASAHADGGPYGWTISTSNTDPYLNTSIGTGGLRTLYLWYSCSTAMPNGPGGMASAVFRIESTGPNHLATTPQNGFLNAGSTDDLLLAVGSCPVGPVVAANLHLDDEALQWRLEQSIRNYDPCISCATHFLNLKIERINTK